jgi:cell filamentation protein
MMIEPYVYAGTNVLVNKFNVRSKEKLDEIEKDVVSFRMLQLREQNLISGNYDFAHYCKFHEYLFQDVYEWAGKPRITSITKKEIALHGDTVVYSQPENIIKDGIEILERMGKLNWHNGDLDRRAQRFSKNMSDLWRVHSFREGNTRTTVMFCCAFACEKGIPIDQELLSENSEYLRRSLVLYKYYDKNGNNLSKQSFLHDIVKAGMERGILKEIEKDEYVERVIKDIRQSGHVESKEILSDMQELHKISKMILTVPEIAEILSKGHENQDICNLALKIGTQFAAQEKQQLEMSEPEP